MRPAADAPTDLAALRAVQAAVAEAIRGKAEVIEGPETRFYGTLEFAIRDNNGYTLIFAQPLTGTRP